jgi:hypothetical protein
MWRSSRAATAGEDIGEEVAASEAGERRDDHPRGRGADKGM